MRRPVVLIPLAFAALAMLLSGCSEGDESASAAAAPTKVCKDRAGWQKLANRIDAPVYCPTWLPDPLVPQLDGKVNNPYNNIYSVDPDRTYLVSFVWQETGAGAAGGELHVNLRGYPGRTRIPTCTRGGTDKRPIPCFSDPRGKVRANGIEATMYTVNQDADQWHVLLAWRHDGGLYTLSEHVAPPLSYEKVVRYLKRELRSLVIVEPAT